MKMMYSLFKRMLIICCCVLVIGCSFSEPKARLCGEATMDYFVPLNEWVPTELRFEQRDLKATIKRTSELQHGMYGSDCSQGAYKAYYSNSKRYLFKRGYDVSLKGSNLCIAEPMIYLWDKHKDKKSALHNLFLNKKNYIKEILGLLTQTIQVQCGQIPEKVQLRYIMRDAYANRAKILKEQGIHSGEFDYYQAKEAGALVKYIDIYRATFYPRRFTSGIRLFTAGGLTADNTSLKDTHPEIRQAYVKIDKQYKDSVALVKHIQGKKRERELNEMYGPIAAVAVAIVQSLTLELADEGLCYFLMHAQKKYTKNDYGNCQNYLYKAQKQLSKNHKGYYALGNLIAAMSKKQPRLVPEGGKVNDAMNKCAKALVSEFGAQKQGEIPTENALRKACENAVIH